MRRIRKIYVGVDYKDCFCFSVGQSAYDNNTIHFIDDNVEAGKFDIYIKKGDTVKFWKDFYKTKVISTEDFID